MGFSAKTYQNVEISRWNKQTMKKDLNGIEHWIGNGETHGGVERQRKA